MKSSAETTSKTASTTVTQTANQPFFAKAGGGRFFAPAAETAMPAVQMKMAVNKPGDKFEQEADRMADKVMRMPAPASSVKEEQIQRQADDKLQKKEEEKIQRTPNCDETLQRKGGDGAPAVAAHTQTAIQNKITGGQPLSGDVRGYMEPRFGADFSNIRIHNDAEAASLSNQLSARAFTYQNHVFFSRDQYQPGTSEGKHLLAHELTHTIQQGQSPQLSPQVSTTVTPPPVQRLGMQDALDYFADKAYYIQGFRLLTIIMGFNPINMRSTNRSAANMLRALIELIPLGHLITQSLDNHGVINKAAAWLEQKVAILGDIGGEVVSSLKRFMDSLSWSDIFDLAGVWERAKHIFTSPISQLISFAGSAAIEILKIVKSAILKPLAAMANGTRGYDLLKAILAEDPITGEPVPRTAETLIGGFMKLIGQEEIWENIKKGNAIARAWAWFQGALESLMGMVHAVPKKINDTLSSLTFVDIVTIAGAFIKIASAFHSIAGNFISWGLSAIWALLKIIFDVVKPGLMGYIQKTGAALKSILKNPIPFLGNLINAAKLGFTNFADHIGAHLKTGLIDWLTGSLEGIYIPQALSLIELGKMALSVLGITWAQIRGKIVTALGSNGEKIMQGLEVGFDMVIALVKGGTAAVWDLIKEKLSDLKDNIISGIINFVTESIVKQAIPKLISMFIPGAGFIGAIISIYDTIMVFVQKISKLVQVVTAFIDSIVTIAGGNIAAAANRVESILSGMLSLSISFLAGFLGLGKITDKIMAVVQKVRANVDKAIETAINWIISKAKSLFSKLFSKRDNPDNRTEEEKDRDKYAAIAEAEKFVDLNKFDGDVTNKKLGPIKSHYRLSSLELHVDSETDSEVTFHFSASASKQVTNKKKDARKKPTEAEMGATEKVGILNINRKNLKSWGSKVLDHFKADPIWKIKLVEVGQFKEAKLDIRHKVSIKDAINYTNKAFKEKTFDEANKMLIDKQVSPAVERTRPGIKAAAIEYLNDVNQDLGNLFVGDMSANRSIGQAYDDQDPAVADPANPGSVKRAAAEQQQAFVDKWAFTEADEGFTITIVRQTKKRQGQTRIYWPGVK